MLYLLCMSPLEDIIKRHGLDFTCMLTIHSSIWPAAEQPGSLARFERAYRCIQWTDSTLLQQRTLVSFFTSICPLTSTSLVSAKHVFSICAISVARIRSCLSTSDTETLAHAFVTCKMITVTHYLYFKQDFYWTNKKKKKNKYLSASRGN